MRTVEFKFIKELQFDIKQTTINKGQKHSAIALLVASSDRWIYIDSIPILDTIGFKNFYQSRYYTIGFGKTEIDSITSILSDSIGFHISDSDSISSQNDSNQKYVDHSVKCCGILQSYTKNL